MLTQDRLDDLVPIEPAAMENRQVIEWDKNDIDTLKFMKVDVLGLGMLGCMRRAFDLLREHKGEDRDLATIPLEGRPTYAHDPEGRHGRRLPDREPRPDGDAAAHQAGQASTTSSSRWRSSGRARSRATWCIPYLRRREGHEKPDYPRPELKRVLEKTLGVPLFQEQAMRVAIECAGFTPSEADQLRRAMATFKLTAGVTKFRDKLVQRHDRPRLRRGVRRADLQAARGLRLLWLPGEPCGLASPRSPMPRPG